MQSEPDKIISYDLKYPGLLSLLKYGKIIQDRFIFTGLGLVMSIWVRSEEVHAQSRAYKKGIRYVEKGNYVAALNQFENLREDSLRHAELEEYMSRCYFELYQPEKALLLIEHLAQKTTTNIYDQIWANYLLENFSEAYRIIQQISWKEDTLIDYLRSKIERAENFYANREGFIVQNFGEKVNSPNREYSAVTFHDYNTILFTSRSQGTSQFDTDGLSFESIYQTNIDSTNHWAVPGELTTTLISHKRHDATVQTYSGGQKMISYHDGKLYISHLEDSTWRIVYELRLHDQTGSDTHGYMTPDEQTIYFASDFESPGGDLDLYQCNRIGEASWSQPMALYQLNTSYDEDAPFLADDGTFYFSSRGYNSIGGYDVFKADYDSTCQCWSAPVNLGHPINSVGEDTYFSRQGKLGYLTSSRPGGYGSLDLYRLFFFNKVKVEGRVTSKDGQTPLSNVEVDLEYDSLLIKSYTDIDGNYTIYMPIHKEMNITFIKDSTKLHEGRYLVNVFFKDANDNEVNFVLSTDRAEPMAMANLSTEEGVKEIKIDIKNDFEENPLIAAVPSSAEGQWVDSLNVVYEHTRKESIKSTRIAGVEMLYFDFDHYRLTSAHHKKLDSLWRHSLHGHTVSIEIFGHADSQGEDKYNQHLSWQRAHAVYQYLIKKKVPSDQMVVRGVGHSSLISNGLDETSHAKNRRVVIKFYISDEKKNH